MGLGLRDYLGSCWRRRISRVVSGPVFLRWEGKEWSAYESEGLLRRRRRRSLWHWQRAEFVFKLWPCRHEVTFRLHRREFPTMAMAREPNAIAAWPGRELPCTVCGPAPLKKDSFDHRPRGWSFIGIGRRRKKRVKVVSSTAQISEGPPQVQAFEAELEQRAMYQRLADVYDS